MKRILSYIEFPQITYEAYTINQLKLYIDIPKILKPLRVLSLKYNLSFQRLFEKSYDPIEFSKYDVILLSDNILLTESKFNRLINDIEKYSSKNARLIVFWVNIVHDISRFKLSERWTIGTFDKSDALKYGFRYYGLYYMYENIKPSKDQHTVDNDIFFVGIDKGRFSHLEKIESDLKSIEVKTNFIFVDSIRSVLNKHFCSPLQYSEIIDNILSTSCIFDYYQKGQSGFTQRLYESIFYNKKLITNNENILKLDIYNENNILYIKNDDTSEIADFLKRPFKPYTFEQRLRYQFGSWLKRVLNDVECDDIK